MQFCDRADYKSALQIARLWREPDAVALTIKGGAVVQFSISCMMCGNWRRWFTACAHINQFIW